jgi:organic hydroperoxide reductase OsmC/OhrA
MDMRGQERRAFRVDLRHAGAYRFISQASEDGRTHGELFASDEPDPVGEASAPPTPSLLGAAIGHCLSASLVETLKHAHISMVDMQTAVTTTVAPNGAGRPRIERVDVVLRPLLREQSPRTTRCQDVFEKNCTVTSSVRDGIDIRVLVDWRYEADDEAGSGNEEAPALPTSEAGPQAPIQHHYGAR